MNAFVYNILSHLWSFQWYHLLMYLLNTRWVQNYSSYSLEHKLVRK